MDVLGVDVTFTMRKDWRDPEASRQRARPQAVPVTATRLRSIPRLRRPSRTAFMRTASTSSMQTAKPLSCTLTAKAGISWRSITRTRPRTDCGQSNPASPPHSWRSMAPRLKRGRKKNKRTMKPPSRLRPGGVIFLYPNAPYTRCAPYGHAHDRHGPLHPFTQLTLRGGIGPVRAVYGHILKRI